LHVAIGAIFSLLQLVAAVTDSSIFKLDCSNGYVHENEKNFVNHENAHIFNSYVVDHHDGRVMFYSEQ